MKIILVCLCALLALPGVVFAEDVDQHDRKWGFGWDEGLTVRRQLGVWQIGLSAGPNDYKYDKTTDLFHPEFPDSLQGLLYYDENDRRESGFVYLELAKKFADRSTLEFSGLLGVRFTWNDFKDQNVRYYVVDGESRMSTYESYSKEWDFMVGTRLAWFVVPWLSLEKKFGLVFSHEDKEGTNWTKDRDETDWMREVYSSSNQSFRSFGSTSLTYDIRIIFWF